MTVHAGRGTKRTCQNEECGVRFYDLMRNPITCPVCHSPFVLPPTGELESARKTYRSVFHRPSVIGAQAAKAPAKELEVPPAPSEADDVDAQIGPENADAILEPEEDDDNPSGVLPQPDDQKD